MSYDESESLFGMEQYCPVHGDESMRECRMCGREFCKTCFTGYRICPTCTEEAEEKANEDDEDKVEDDELAGLGDLLGEDLEEEEDDEEDLDAKFSGDLDLDNDGGDEPEDSEDD